MTELKKPISRVSRGMVFEAGKFRPVVVTLEPPYLLKFRAKGCKRAYSLTTDACYTMAVKADVATKKAAKKREKKRQAKDRRKSTR